MPDERALVIGRFQPPHRGHMACIRSAAEIAEEVVVAIGSAQRSHSIRDPFTASERIEMLAAACDEEELPVRHIIPVPDLDQYHLWVAQVVSYVPPFDVVVTGSPMTQRLFEDATVPVRRIEVEARERLQGRTVRQRILAGEDVSDDVPPVVADLLEDPEIRARLAAIAEAAEGATG